MVFCFVVFLYRSHQDSFLFGDSSHRRGGRESWTEKRKKDLIQSGAAPEQTALSLDPWGQAAALSQQVQGSIRPHGRIRVEVTVETDPAGLPGFRGHRKPWAPFWGLNGFFSGRKQMLALFEGLFVSLCPPPLPALSALLPQA